jgi:aminopeptidase N
MGDDNHILGRDEAAARAALLSDVAYDVEVDLGDGRATTFRSTSHVTFTCLTPGSSSFIDLSAEHIDAITLNGIEIDPGLAAPHRVPLSDLRTTNELTVVAHCAYQRTGTGLHRFIDPTDDAVYVHTQFEPFDAHLVYACFDQPDIKARFLLTVRAPHDWTVVSNEPVASRTATESDRATASTTPTTSDTDIWRFDVTPSLSTYVTALVAGPLHEVRASDDGVPMALYCRQSLAEHLDPDEIFEITRAGMAFYAEMFGQPYPFSKYDQLFVPEFNFGAMENAGCVTFNESYLFRSRVTEAARMGRGATILHELAHMWFGDLVTMRWWGDLWLNESFATYVSFWALASATRFTDAWVQFINREVTWAVRQDQLPTTHPIVADAPDTDTAINNFDGITYAKGALVLRQLVAWVGTDAFVTGLRDYFARHAWGNATLGDFLAALEKTSGRSMDRWARQWLETSGINTLELATAVDGQGRYTHAEVVQHPSVGGDVDLRDQRIAIGLYDVDDGDVVRRTAVELDVTGQTTQVPTLVGHRPPSMVFPNDGLRSYAKVRLDDVSLQTLLDHLSAVDDPLTRAQGWLVAWDLLRDGVLPASRYVRLVADHAAAETQTDTLRTLTRQAVAAADRYGAPAARAAAHGVLATAAREALAASDPGSDAQLVWARCRIVVDDPTWALGLLSGDAVPDGLTVDHDLRWHAVISLASQGRMDADGIEQVRADDPTDEGRAARPRGQGRSLDHRAGRTPPIGPPQSGVRGVPPVRPGRAVGALRRPVRRWARRSVGRTGPSGVT